MHGIGPNRSLGLTGRTPASHHDSASDVKMACGGAVIGFGERRAFLPREAVEHFRGTVEVVDLVGDSGLDVILGTVGACSQRNPGPAEPFEPEQGVEMLGGYLPERMTSDPAGYFVLYVDQQRGMLSLEHYENSGVLNCVIEGKTPGALYSRAIERGLVSRLDHAAYLGGELARAEQAMLSGEPYVQDAAPEAAVEDGGQNCGCQEACAGES